MAWVKLDDTAPEHPKQLDAGPQACWLWVCGLAYCNRQPRRDGFIPAVKVPQLYPMPSPLKWAARLVEVGLWEEAEGGYLIHDYHEYQPSPEVSAKRSEAGRLGGIKSGATRRSKPEANASSKTPEANEAPSRPGPSLPDPVPTEEAKDHTHARAGAIPVPRTPEAVFKTLWPELLNGKPVSGDSSAVATAARRVGEWATATGQEFEPALRHLLPAFAEVIAFYEAAARRGEINYAPPRLTVEAFAGIGRSADYLPVCIDWLAGKKPVLAQKRGAPALAMHPDSVSDLEKSFES